MSKFLIGGLVAIFVLGIAGFFLFPNNQKSSTNETGQIESSPFGRSEYKGKVLAGTNSKYVEFNSEDYEKAKMMGKIIFLDFYANWCPICRVEAPDILSGFNALDSNEIVGFRVNFNDSETDEAEKALAKEFETPGTESFALTFG